MSSRITFQRHDFFNPQPVIDADVYLLPLVRPGARILVMDTVLPIPGSVPVSEEALLRVRDLTMMQTFNTHERGREEWEELVHAADSLLKINRAIQPVGSGMAVLEVGRGW
ncbi:hypothetical protein BDV28DRAFT_149778 [Aspergillus coremiiformis]|uniref:O-methyltransferase domain-containing protein n=1 Tax=Aspergillus coremiiformis TaxID=138285 RepID=A0A5N6Z2N9_9EURO|nr:hypothetical protein BDV28DRAFT_149778 [Aspergillus coremiiformis]